MVQPVEVGCRGVAGQSVWRALGILGVMRKERRNLICKAAEDGSRWVWQKIEEPWVQK